MNQQEVREEVPYFLFSRRGQCNYFPIGPLEYTSHLYLKEKKRKGSFKKREKRNKGVSEKDSPTEHVKPCCHAGILSMFILRCPFSLSTIRQLFHSFLFQVEFMRCENIPL